MKNFVLSILFISILTWCVNNNHNNWNIISESKTTILSSLQTTGSQQIQVIINDIPFSTEKYFRIPYTIKGTRLGNM